jgi:dCMP deaminase
MRISRDQTALKLVAIWAERGTCVRRKVGCVLMDGDGYVLASGYNGPSSGEPHCIDRPCPGASAPSGEGLELCQAIHAEANALMFCPDVRRIRIAYVTSSPCLHCVKLLMSTGCRRIVFSERYAHDDEARAMWVRSSRSRGEGLNRAYDRTWELQT